MTARPAHLRVTLAAGESRPHVPCLLDCRLGAARPATLLDGGGTLDRALGGAGLFRARAVFHARPSLRRVGQQAAGYTDDEERLALSRTYLVEIGDPAQTANAVDRLRGLAVVESAAPELLARSYLMPGTRHTGRPTRAEAEVPFAMVRAAQAASVEPGDERVHIGVIDTGVALEHPEIADVMLAGYDFVDLGIQMLSQGFELLGDSAQRDDMPDDEVGHGTHVSGVIGAAGLRVPRGVAGDCRMIPLRVLAGARSGPHGKPFGIGSLSDIDAAVKCAVDSGAAVVNLSLGTSAAELDPHAPAPHAEVCRYAEERGTVAVAASGNDGTEVPFYPAALPTVLAVGSVDAAGDRSTFTSGGPHVRLHAPGEEVVGLSLHGYRRSTGTSHAAPFVSGAAALVVAHAIRRGARPTAAAVRSILLDSARPRAPGGPPVLDIAAALDLTERRNPPTTDPDGRSAP